MTLHYPRTGKTFDVAVVDDLAGLVWAVNLSTVELHPFLAPCGDLEHPHALVLDLDPGRPARLVHACQVALLARAELERCGLASYPKSSGSKGLHVYAPVRELTFRQTKGVAREIARHLAVTHPALVVDRQDKALRQGRVLVDWSQNDPGRSTVAPYSLRGFDPPSVSTPLTWREVEQAVLAGTAGALVASPERVLERLQTCGDLFAAVAATS